MHKMITHTGTKNTGLIHDHKFLDTLQRQHIETIETFSLKKGNAVQDPKKILNYLLALSQL